MSTIFFFFLELYFANCFLVTMGLDLRTLVGVRETATLAHERKLYPSFYH